MLNEFATLETTIDEIRKAISESAEGSSQIAEHVSTIADNVSVIVEASEFTKGSSEKLRTFIEQYKC